MGHHPDDDGPRLAELAEPDPDGHATADELALLDRLDQLDALERKLDDTLAGIARIETAFGQVVTFADDLHERLKPMLESGPFAAIARMAGNGRD